MFFSLPPAGEEQKFKGGAAAANGSRDGGGGTESQASVRGTSTREFYHHRDRLRCPTHDGCWCWCLLDAGGGSGGKLLVLMSVGGSATAIDALETSV